MSVMSQFFCSGLNVHVFKLNGMKTLGKMGLVRDGIKPLPETMLTCHWRPISKEVLKISICNLKNTLVTLVISLRSEWVSDYV